MPTHLPGRVSTASHGDTHRPVWFPAERRPSALKSQDATLDLHLRGFAAPSCGESPGRALIPDLKLGAPPSNAGRPFPLFGSAAPC